MKKILIFGGLSIIMLTAIIFGVSRRASAPTSLNSNIAIQSNLNSNDDITLENINSNTSAPISKSNLVEPVADFRARVTKKLFGMYINPQNSPISPERFTGYHTGADAEYQDVSADVPVYAVADGTVVLSRTASGYGGVFMIEITLDGAKHTVLYGHIRPSSLPKVGQKVTKGEQIALLGTGYSSETDGERRHLHFSILADASQNIKGYVSSKSQLSSWLDPLNYF